MNKIHKIAKFCTLLFLCCLLAPMIAFGQASMSSSGSGSWGDPTTISNFPDVLVSGGGVNAWHNLNFTAASVSSDNEVTYAVDSSCNGYLYSENTQTFTKHTEWGCVAQLHQGGDGNLYAIHRHTSGGYYLGRWNASNSSWTDLSCCFVAFAVGNGSPVMVAHDVNGTIWVSTNYGTTFSTKPWCNAISEAVDGIDANNNPSFEVVCSDDTFAQYTNSTWGTLPGNGVLIAHGFSGLYMVGTLGKANHYNGTSWDAIVSNTPITSLAVGDGFVFGVTSGNAYALSDTGIEFTRNYSGTVGCAPNVPQSLCNTFTHTSELQICIAEHCGAKVTGTPFNGNGQWGLTAKVHANDILNCWDVAEACVPSEPTTDGGDMHCSGGGSNTDTPSTEREGHTYTRRGSGPIQESEPAWTGTIWVGTVKFPTASACLVGVPTCPVYNLTFLEKDPTLVGVQAAMAAAPFSGPWMTLTVYDPANIPASCRQLVVFKHVVPDICD